MSWELWFGRSLRLVSRQIRNHLQSQHLPIYVHHCVELDGFSCTSESKIEQFGCALCPRDDAFLRSVSKEIKDQMRRLSKHVSIALWSGNNENELTLDWTQGVLEHRDIYVVDYTELYLNSIRTAVLSVDTSRPFWPSSPSNGPLSESPYVMRWGNGGDSARGDVHFYNYDDICTRVSMYAYNNNMSYCSILVASSHLRRSIQLHMTLSLSLSSLSLC
jgi:hypothetical protein